MLILRTLLYQTYLIGEIWPVQSSKPLSQAIFLILDEATWIVYVSFSLCSYGNWTGSSLGTTL